VFELQYLHTYANTLTIHMHIPTHVCTNTFTYKHIQQPTQKRACIEKMLFNFVHGCILPRRVKGGRIKNTQNAHLAVAQLVAGLSAPKTNLSKVKEVKPKSPKETMSFEKMSCFAFG